jgi:CRISPR-associated protein Cas1
VRQKTKPKQILLSKRANVFYLEHVRVMQKDERIVYLTNEGGELDRFFNLPERNTIFLLLGKGSSITDAAARRLAESNVLVGFTGNGGSPLLSAISPVFLTPLSEYRPTEYMQKWAHMWFDDSSRLKVAKSFFVERLCWIQESWDSSAYLKQSKILLATSSVEAFKRKLESASTTAELMAVEGEWAKMLYGMLARGFSFNAFRREEGKQSRATSEDTANSFIDHGNYIAYGYAASCLNVLGISFAFPVMHGKTRRGGLVFDVADLFKDALVLPLAFKAAFAGYKDQPFRDELIETCQTQEVMDRIIEIIIKAVP